MMLNGEMVFFLDNIEYSSKSELLAILRAERNATYQFEGEQRAVLKQLLGLCIQQVLHTGEETLLEYKNFCRRY